jgi:hypothetical protein
MVPGPRNSVLGWHLARNICPAGSSGSTNTVFVKTRYLYTDLDVTTDCNYNWFVTFEWDEGERRANLRKHAVDFLDVPQVFEGPTLTLEDTRFEYGETRFVTLGLLKSLVVVVVHTERGGKIRVISARKATRYETQAYYERIAN